MSNKDKSRSAVLQTQILNSTDKLRKNGMHVGPAKSTAQVRRNAVKGGAKKAQPEGIKEKTDKEKSAKPKK